MLIGLDCYVPVNQMGMSMVKLNPKLTAKEQAISNSVFMYLCLNSSPETTFSSQSENGKQRFKFWRT